MMSRQRKLLRWILAAGVVTSAAAFLVPAGLKYLGESAERGGEFLAAPLGLALVLALVHRSGCALGWSVVLAALGCRPPLVPAARIWLSSESCRWLPGGVWHVGSRAVQGTSRGIPAPVVVASMALELLLALAASLALAAAGLVVYGNRWGDMGDFVSGRALEVAVIAGLAITVVAAVAYRILPRKYRALRERLTALRLVRPRPRPLLVCIALYLLLTLVNGLAFYTVAVAVAPDAQVPMLAAVAANAVAWVGGMMAATSAGLGVREALLVLQLGPWLPIPEAVFVSVVWRGLLIAAELLCLLAACALPLCWRGVARCFWGRNQNPVLNKGEQP